MIAELQLDLARMRGAPIASGPVLTERVVSCDGGLIEVAGLPLPVGSLGVIENGAGSESLAEVIGFRAGHSLMMLLGDTMLLRPRASVRALGNPGEVRVGEALLGRAVDALGQPIDGGPRLDLPHAWPLAGQREGALERASVAAPFDCGVRAINALATMGVGQRLGIMAGSGVGKSVLVDTVAGHAVADVTVVALIGERRARFRTSSIATCRARGAAGSWWWQCLPITLPTCDCARRNMPVPSPNISVRRASACC
jgi:Flagellar biosynthesis/type III secretory pathway ATPase